ncbi:MAG: 6-carboxytetrahydropterin synthase [Phycisphaerae bacterium]|nr:6-carboxytetrahydropterin synthase [Phycisphaerae bacterium]
MYRIAVTTNFRASHQLKFADMTESCHRHDWKAEAAVGGQGLDDNGLLFDFNKLKKILESIVCRLDGRKLEDLECFENTNASAENVARYIYDSIKSQLPKNIDLLYVEVTETPGCKTRYGESR